MPSAVGGPVDARGAGLFLANSPRVLRAEEVARHQAETDLRRRLGQNDPPVVPVVGAPEHYAGAVLDVERPDHAMGRREQVGGTTHCCRALCGSSSRKR